MIGSFHLSKEYREIYLRYILQLLYEKYFVTFSKLAKEAGFPPSYLHDLRSGRKGIGKDGADRLESFLNDLYGGIIEYETPEEPQEFLKFMNSLWAEDIKYGKKSMLK